LIDAKRQSTPSLITADGRQSLTPLPEVGLQFQGGNRTPRAWMLTAETSFSVTPEPHRQVPVITIATTIRIYS